MDIKEQKKELRRQIRKLKSLLTKEEKEILSAKIFEKLEQCNEFVSSHCVLMYWSMDDEVCTHGFVNKWYKDKVILLPCVEGDDLVLKQFKGEENMTEGEQFAIPEPKGEEFTRTDEIDLMIIPGMAFDMQKNRMGRGRGFYDRLLQTCNCTKIAVGFDCQMTQSVPVEPFDVKMDKIITDKRTAE
ncbi:MAG: 5-formyltetrahydrofolate cyclo-ligase [Bacteroidales bacterium]|nr:5-formyltetrahydrofolate cyclo-ligase [Bacteroidales bacterium]